MKKFLFVDTETTGLDSKINGIHQVAGILVIEGEVVEKFDLKFRPKEEEKIDRMALEVSSLTEKEVIERDLSSFEAYYKFNKKMTKHIDKYDREDKAIIAGYNCPFDAQFLNDWYAKHGNKYFFGLFHGGAYLDGLSLAVQLEIKEGKRLFRPNRKLDTVAKTLGVKLDNAHDALADINATREVINILWRKVIG